MRKHIFLWFAVVLTASFAYTQNSPLILSCDDEYIDCWYENTDGNIIIDSDKYEMLFTDTFYTMAVVLTKDFKFMGIDRSENLLFEIYAVDNGPDYTQDGLFRIIENGKIGYADLEGNIVIEPQYKCAFAFEEGRAKVSNTCTESRMDEYTIWESESWLYIDKEGNILD